jgi:hypothetical protein
MKHNYEVKNVEIETALREIGNDLKQRMPQGWGFTLFILSHGEGGATFYISTIERSDMIKAMKEFIKRQEKEV